MRAIAISVWIFINLGFLGMCGYIYLIWTQYWYHSTRQTSLKQLLQRRTKIDLSSQVVFYEPEKYTEHEKPQIHKRESQVVNTRSHPRNKPKNTCLKNNTQCGATFRVTGNLEKFKNDLFVQLRRVLHEESSVFKTDNPYNVNYEGPRGNYHKFTPDQLRCLFKKVNLRTVSQQDAPFSKLEFGNLLDKGEVFDGNLESCAVVTNAASLLNSGLGPKIDDHEVVVRFNHAPTENYEEDVGSKTSLRVVNSQVVSKEKFEFTTNPMYRNVNLVVWDPSNYSATLPQWYETPDFDFFSSWAKHKAANPSTKSFILDPRAIWRIWDYIQSLVSFRIRRNPPSSGFLGLALLLPYCRYVDVFEFVPSMRLTSRCHYFDNLEDTSCTFGVWHPLAAEKLLSIAMNDVNDTTVFQEGFIRIRGFQNLHC